MSKELILMIHPAVGVLGVLAAVWVFAETLNASADNIGRIRTASLLSAAFIWLAYVVGGYWYVVNYAADKALIKAGPWPFAHEFFMEAKEHVFLSLLLVATLLPIATFADLKSNRPARLLVYWSSAIVVALGLGMEGAGAFIAMGAKVALAAQ
ncbi:hypothetical protein [Chelativorans xinjiangense]|uniref:hypothetical protein n=1 Tax=Chelativorans xinjiangense TaxID=2681485 RepID=UPI0013595843|nr:hypothetical protein [Chelativorans xinjiangense]